MSESIKNYFDGTFDTSLKVKPNRTTKTSQGNR